MAMFGSNWNDEPNSDCDGSFSRWKDDQYEKDNYYSLNDLTKPKTTDEILDEIDISEIEKYLRKKKLQNINKNERQK
jgi:hypothetical protein